MPLYVTLGPDGAAKLLGDPDRLNRVNLELASLGVRVLEQFALLGPYDFCNIVEAPDEKVMAKVALTLGARGTLKTLTITAIPVDEFVASLE